jgi:hypothetical protein
MLHARVTGTEPADVLDGCYIFLYSLSGEK